MSDPGASSTTSQEGLPQPSAHALHSLNWPPPLQTALPLGVGPEGCILGPGKPRVPSQEDSEVAAAGEGAQAPNQFAAKHAALN